MDTLEAMQQAHAKLKERTTLEVKVGYNVDDNERWFFIRIGDSCGDSEFIVGSSLDDCLSHVNTRLKKLESPEFKRAAELRREADELIARLNGKASA